VPRTGWEDFFFSMIPASCAASSSCEVAALAAWKLLGLQRESPALVEINPSFSGGTVRIVLCYVVFERVACFPRRLGSGLPQHVTKLAKEGLAIGALGIADCRPAGDERFGTLRRHG
jgi:hypothetical protein